MIVLQEMSLGSLRSNLLIKKCNPNDKFYNLYNISKSLSSLHKCDLVHGDLHSGNLLFNNTHDCYISDFGLSRPADQPFNSSDIYGILPYVAPEVLRSKPYTKAADIYSFGIIMWEFTSGVPAFDDMPHDHHLFTKICKGYRPIIVEGTHPDYVELMKKCWDSDPNKRPSAEELEKLFEEWKNKYPIENNDRNKVSAVKIITEGEPVIKHHPMSCYVSRKLNEINVMISKDLGNDSGEIDRAFQELEF
ncbi:kinase-like domain-containing protein [Rhizophagus diaphanus]|nr:kinase-like domain-containing protein [Rhizophagus diaphanus] [Rhizophagus sp. MUCL 43196]